MLTNRVSLLVAYAVVLICGGAAPPPPASGGGGGPIIEGSVMGQQAPFPRIPEPGDFDTTTEWSDMRRLMVGSDCPTHCRLGPMAWIQPNRNAPTWGQAERDAGEVIARMISDSAYPKFNLQYRGKEQRDTVFWAVMKRGDSVISVFHSTTRGTKDLITTTEVIKHGPGFFRGLALARWLWNDKDDMAWGTCDGGACCKSPGR